MEINKSDMTGEQSSRYLVCRICYGTEENAESLIHPCKCTGSVGNVHEECLKTWLLSTNPNLKDRSCELCKSPYSMEVKVKYSFAFSKLCKGSLTSCIFAIILFSMITLIVIIIFFLSQRLKNSAQGDSIYIVALLIGCCIGLMILLLLVFYLFKSLVYLPKVSIWKIKNYERIEEIVVEKVLSNNYVQTQDNEIFIKIKSLGKGTVRKTVCPKVMPLNVVPVIESGRLVRYDKDLGKDKLSSSACNNVEYELIEDNEVRFVENSFNERVRFDE